MPSVRRGSHELIIGGAAGGLPLLAHFDIRDSATSMSEIEG